MKDELGAVLKTKNNQIKNYIYDKLGGTLEILCHPV